VPETSAIEHLPIGDPLQSIATDGAVAHETGFRWAEYEYPYPLPTFVLGGFSKCVIGFVVRNW